MKINTTIDDSITNDKIIGQYKFSLDDDMHHDNEGVDDLDALYEKGDVNLYDVTFLYSTNDEEYNELINIFDDVEWTSDPYESYKTKHPDRYVNYTYTNEEKVSFIQKYMNGFSGVPDKMTTINNSYNGNFTLNVPTDSDKILFRICFHGKDRIQDKPFREYWNNADESFDPGLYKYGHILYPLTIKYCCGDTVLGTKSVYADGGETILIKCPKFEGYTSEESIVYNMPKTSSEKQIDYQKETFNVNFDSLNGGSTPESQIVQYNEKLQKPTAIPNEGYKLDGWYTETDFINKWDFVTNLVTSNMTLYAKWNKSEPAAITSSDNPDSIDAITSSDNPDSIVAITNDNIYIWICVLTSLIILSSICIWKKTHYNHS